MIKNKAEILAKLQIAKLNPMQLEAEKAIGQHQEVILLSPTGTGKTLAFLLPILSQMDTHLVETQTLIVVPTRELAIQIEQVAREMGTGHKIQAVYGGRPFSKDLLEMETAPSLVIGTPGRVSDHLRRESFDPKKISTLILDEFDKSLEIGFESEMSDILNSLTALNKKILTSATSKSTIPVFMEMNDAVEINYLGGKSSNLSLKIIHSPEKDKLNTLIDTLCVMGSKTGIIFCNFKDSIQRISDYLVEHNIGHGLFYGGMEQKDRERALIKFRNGTYRILLSTDLAGRGIDVPEIDYILHYHLPNRADEFTHRNGRTARMNAQGAAYIIHHKSEKLPSYIDSKTPIEKLKEASLPEPSLWNTVFVSGGRKDKISKGDIVGLFVKQGGLTQEEIGSIELKQDCAFVGVNRKKSLNLVGLVNNSKLKKKKVRITII